MTRMAEMCVIRFPADSEYWVLYSKSQFCVPVRDDPVDHNISTFWGEYCGLPLSRSEWWRTGYV